MQIELYIIELTFLSHSLPLKNTEDFYTWLIVSFPFYRVRKLARLLWKTREEKLKG